MSGTPSRSVGSVPPASGPILFTWHQIQRTAVRFQGKTETVLLRPRGTLRGEISLCFHLKCSKSVPLLPRKARAKESASPIPALPVLRVPPGGGRNAPDDGVKSRWRIEPPTGWKRGRTTGVWPNPVYLAPDSTDRSPFSGQDRDGLATAPRDTQRRNLLVFPSEM
jgi:hypothetical protein